MSIGRIFHLSDAFNLSFIMLDRFQPSPISIAMLTILSSTLMLTISRLNWPGAGMVEAVGMAAVAARVARAARVVIGVGASERQSTSGHNPQRQLVANPKTSSCSHHLHP